MEDALTPGNRAERRAEISAAQGGSKKSGWRVNEIKNKEKYGWRVSEWSAAIGCSRATTYELLASGNISSVKLGGARIITTHPKDFLASLANDMA